MTNEQHSVNKYIISMANPKAPRLFVRSGNCNYVPVPRFSTSEAIRQKLPTLTAVPYIWLADELWEMGLYSPVPSLFGGVRPGTGLAEGNLLAGSWCNRNNSFIGDL